MTQNKCFKNVCMYTWLKKGIDACMYTHTIPYMILKVSRFYFQIPHNDKEALLFSSFPILNNVLSSS